MRLNLLNIVFLLWMPALFGQVKEEMPPPDTIKSVIFKGTNKDQFPVVKINEPFYLEFDDLSASEQDYYYELVHCNYDWTPSDLLKSQYLKGMDNQRIARYENSFNTLQPYSHYKLGIPNQLTRLKVGGNYMIEIYNISDELQFSRRFVVYNDLVEVNATVKRSRSPKFLNTKQTVQFTIESGEYELVDPRTEVKVVILQNYYWPTAKQNVPPQYTLGTQLIYKYDQETSFFAGNEFLYFDTSDIRETVAPIARTVLKDLYNEYLYPNKYRYNIPYTYGPDIDGNFVIRTLQGEDASIEADYTRVHFRLPYADMLGTDEVYVFGKFNNYALTDENKMKLNPKNGMMEGELKLKQGFYNYKYVVKHNGQIDLNTICGNFHATENEYLVLVYYRAFGELYDSVIGVGSVNSKNISD